MRIIKNLANYITLGNLVCGCISIYFLFENKIDMAFWLIIVAAVLDFFDGFVARLVKADSEMGKQLDSLADMVSFGVAPGLIWMKLMQNQLPIDLQYCLWVWLAVPMGACWRLAKFNVSTNQTTEFIGVPSPITGITIGSLALISGVELYGLLFQPLFLITFPLFAGFMMVANWPMLALKFKKEDKKLPYKLCLLVGSILLILGFQRSGMFFVFLYFIICSLIANFATREKQ